MESMKPNDVLEGSYKSTSTVCIIAKPSSTALNHESRTDKVTVGVVSVMLQSVVKL